jgi:hypothetical protein
MELSKRYLSESSHLSELHEKFVRSLRSFRPIGNGPSRRNLFVKDYLIPSSLKKHAETIGEKECTGFFKCTPSKKYYYSEFTLPTPKRNDTKIATTTTATTTTENNRIVLATILLSIEKDTTIMAHDNQNNTILDDMNNYDWVRDSWVASETESCYYCVN